ncbi:MAG: DinB family protein [Gemmatimonadaceae bacterium]|nr:DinB family protein [Gemmatimonadaceae bacterium]
MPTDASPGVDRQLGKLIDHLEWADRRVLDSLRAMSHPDQRALDLYAHVLGAEHVWLSRIREVVPREKVWPELTVDRAAELAAGNAAALRALLESLSPDQLQRKVAYSNSAGTAFESTVEDMLLQIALHGCYHRGQVAMVVRGAGAEPAPTDYIAFVRGAPAAVTPPPRR